MEILAAAVDFSTAGDMHYVAFVGGPVAEGFGRIDEKAPARRAGCVGITAMAKYCKELVNIGPVAFLNQCRIDHAAQALRETPDIAVTQIAMRLGFNSSQYFATLFRKHHQMTPMQYRSRKVAR